MEPDPVLYEGEWLHPECAAVRPFVLGRCLEIGPGWRPSHPSVIGVDRVPPGRTGEAGVVLGRPILASVCADGAQLPFAGNALDSLVARHVLEHWADTLAVLREWCRVLKPGAPFGIVVPDQRHHAGNTVKLDPTHEAAFTAEQLAALCEHAGLAVDGHRRVTGDDLPERMSCLVHGRKRLCA